MTRPLQLRFLLIALACVVAAVWWPEAAWLACPLLFMPVLQVGCELFADAFATDQLATAWDDRSGTWTVGSGVLSCTSASALIVTTTTLGSGATGAHSTVSMTFGATTDIGRIILGYTDDNNYWFAEVHHPATSSGTVKVFERSGGVSTQRGSTGTFSGAVGSPISACFAIGDSRVIAKATGGAPGTSGFVIHNASPSMGSTKGGLGTGAGSASASFDNYVLNTHNADNPSCNSCDLSNCSPALCEGGIRSVVPVSITFSSISDGGCTECDPLLNTTVAMNLDWDGALSYRGFADISACSGFFRARVELGCNGGVTVTLAWNDGTVLTAGFFLKWSGDAGTPPFNCDSTSPVALTFQPFPQSDCFSGLCGFPSCAGAASFQFG